MSFFLQRQGEAFRAGRRPPDQVEKFSDQAIERGGDAVDSTTGGKYAEQVDQAQVKADGPRQALSLSMTQPRPPTTRSGASAVRPALPRSADRTPSCVL